MAYDFLVDHALKNVWCTPEQDYQAVVKPARLTPALGVFNKVDVMWRTHQLPVVGVRFHVYQIGQLHPLLMGLFPVQSVWEKFSDACGLRSLIVDLYGSSGVQLPRSECWYMVTPDKNLLVAVKHQARVPLNLVTEDLYLRVYSNAYFNSTRADTVNDVVVVQGGTLGTTADILALQTQYLNYRSKPGLTSAYVNGFLVDQIDLVRARIGDVAEFVYDSSVLRIQEWTVGELKTFQSSLDRKFKYLLHYSGSDDGTIDFYDDNDVFVIQPGTAGRYQGVLYHRNAADAVRQLTHRDYSVVVAYIQSYADANQWGNPLALTLRLVVRKSGYLRALVNEDSRIKELYKLPEPALTNALLGVDAVVENWTADALESAAYPQLMRSAANEIDLELVERAYGYNAISKLVADTPQFTREFSGQQIVDVPYGLQARSTAYEHDASGRLIGWHTHLNSATYAARSLATNLIEMVMGDVADELDETLGQPTQFLDPKANYRFYRCPLVAGVPTNAWEDVSGSGQYAVSPDGKQLTWLLDPSEWYTLVRSDRTSLGYTLNLDASDGLLDFSLTCRQVRFSSLGTYVMQIPQGELDLWLNGQALIEGLDYVVQFPKIVIVNKQYLVDPANQLQRVDVRFCGFCKADLSRENSGDRGFVVYGELSHNKRFDIRDDKVMRIVVNGALYDRSELVFSEDNPAIQITDARNGSPYQIRDLVVPMRGLTPTGTYQLRAHSQEIDQRVSDYLTLHAPEPVQASPSAIVQYTVYSPFVGKILRDLQRGILSDPILQQHYNDNDVVRLCQPYEWLLDYDPSQDAHASDARFVLVHPHNQPNVVSVDAYHYKFLSRVVAIYCNRRVDLSHQLRLTAI